MHRGFVLERKLVLTIWNICHILTHVSDGRGGRRRILVMLQEHGGLPQNELTRKLGIQPGTVSETLGRMETAGLIVRLPSETDRRTTDVRLTPEGELQAAEAAIQRETLYKSLFKCLSEEEKKTLYTLLRKVARDWEQKETADR